jgi:hypothetical protein
MSNSESRQRLPLAYYIIRSRPSRSSICYYELHPNRSITYSTAPSTNAGYISLHSAIAALLAKVLDFFIYDVHLGFSWISSSVPYDCRVNYRVCVLRLHVPSLRF